MVARVQSLDEAAAVELVRRRDIQMHGGVVWIDGHPASVTMQLKAAGVGLVIPHLAGFLAVRQQVNAAARRQINEFNGYVIIEGRDVGYMVTPEAPLRLLLVVSPEVAAQRSLEHSVAEVIARDTRDRAHPYGALKQSSDTALYTQVLSTDHHTPESIRDEVFELMRQVFRTLPEQKRIVDE
jgi:cytidylate kinase